MFNIWKIIDFFCLGLIYDFSILFVQQLFVVANLKGRPRDPTVFKFSRP